MEDPPHRKDPSESKSSAAKPYTELLRTSKGSPHRPLRIPPGSSALPFRNVARHLLSSPWASYVMTAFLVGLALFVRRLLGPWLQETAPFATLYVAVAFCAWYWGPGPSLVAAALGALAIDYWFIPPVGSLYISRPGHITALVVFLCTSLVIAAMGQANRSNLRTLTELQQNLHKRINERTRELEKTNVRIRQQAETLELANKSLSTITAQVMKAQDEERRRIARDLHDSTGQTVALLCINLSRLHEDMKKIGPELSRRVEENAALAREISDDLRTTSYLLHPPMLDQMGLLSALRWYVDGLKERTAIKVDLQVEKELARLPMDCETAIFRIVQTCLTNIQLHSGSPTALIRLYKSLDGIILQIRDEGKGIPHEKLPSSDSTGAHGVGLRGMRERVADLGGKFEIASGEKGTEITVAFPVPAFRAASG